MKPTAIFYIFTLLLLSNACKGMAKNELKNKPEVSIKDQKSEEEWERVLTPQQFHILRKKGTDLPETGAYTYHFEKGMYKCAACDTPLFISGTKYESHCGWPSFDDAIEGAIIMQADYSHNMIRTEIVCANCGGHLGHIFDDGPKETTGKRYCVNSTSLNFVKQKNETNE
jgi:peptide-methionine (R)-S-oxide reductase